MLCPFMASDETPMAQNQQNQRADPMRQTPTYADLRRQTPTYADARSARVTYAELRRQRYGHLLTAQPEDGSSMSSSFPVSATLASRDTNELIPDSVPRSNCALPKPRTLLQTRGQHNTTARSVERKYCPSEMLTTASCPVSPVSIPANPSEELKQPEPTIAARKGNLGREGLSYKAQAKDKGSVGYCRRPKIGAEPNHRLIQRRPTPSPQRTPTIGTEQQWPGGEMLWRPTPSPQTMTYSEMQRRPASPVRTIPRIGIEPQQPESKIFRRTEAIVEQDDSSEDESERKTQSLPTLPSPVVISIDSQSSVEQGRSVEENDGQGSVPLFERASLGQQSPGADSELQGRQSQGISIARGRSVEQDDADIAWGHWRSLSAGAQNRLPRGLLEDKDNIKQFEAHLELEQKIKIETGWKCQSKTAVKDSKRQVFGNVEVWSRPFEKSKEQGKAQLSEWLFSGTIDCDCATYAAVACDIGWRDQWDKGTREVAALQDENWYWCAIAPPPLSDREYIFRVACSRLPNGCFCLSQIAVDPLKAFKMRPENSSRVRVHDYFLHGIFRPLEDGSKCQFTIWHFQDIRAEGVPTFILDRLLQVSLENECRDLKNASGTYPRQRAAALW